MTPMTNSVEPTTSATDELRCLLDERGVEYTVVHGYREYIWEFGESGIARASAIGTRGLVQMIVANVTPEQAVAATLGAVEYRKPTTLSQLEAENAKLRELAKEACELARIFYDCGGTFNDLDDLLCEASELGIEVDS